MSRKEKILKSLRDVGSYGHSSSFLSYVCYTEGLGDPPLASIRRTIGELRAAGHKITCRNGFYRLAS